MPMRRSRVMSKMSWTGCRLPGSITVETLVHSFLVCGLANTLDGSQDDLVSNDVRWELSEDEPESNDIDEDEKVTLTRLTTIIIISWASLYCVSIIIIINGIDCTKKMCMVTAINKIWKKNFFAEFAQINSRLSRARWAYIRVKIRLSRINAKRPKVVAEKGGRIFVTVRYYYCCCYYYYYYYYDAEFTIIIRQTELLYIIRHYNYMLWVTPVWRFMERNSGWSELAGVANSPLTPLFFWWSGPPFILVMEAVAFHPPFFCFMEVVRSTPLWHLCLPLHNRTAALHQISWGLGIISESDLSNGPLSHPL